MIQIGSRTFVCVAPSSSQRRPKRTAGFHSGSGQDDLPLAAETPPVRSAKQKYVLRALDRIFVLASCSILGLTAWDFRQNFRGYLIELRVQLQETWERTAWATRVTALVLHPILGPLQRYLRRVEHVQGGGEAVCSSQAYELLMDLRGRV